MIRGRDKFQKYKVFIIFFVKVFSLVPTTLNIKLLNTCRYINGQKGLLIRYVIFKNIAISCGENVSIHPGVYFFNTNNISIGNNVSIHPMCYIDGAGGIDIGSDVSIAHGVTIMSSAHKFSQIEIPIKDQGISLHKTIIKSNVWIGAKSTILGGTAIENGSIVAAGAVINKSVDSFTIVGGIPGKKIKERKL